MRPSRLLSCGLILWQVAAVAAAGEEPSSKSGLEDIVLADQIRIAFYEVAPRSVGASMRRAVEEVCARHEPAEASGDTRTESSKAVWLCSGKSLGFLRAVVVTGSKMTVGYVCDAEFVDSGVRYYTVDMFTDDTACVSVSYSYDLKKHFIDDSDLAGTRQP